MNIEISIEDMQLIISLKLKEQGLNPDTTACILGLIDEDENKLQTLFKQIIGLDQSPHYSEGDIVAVPLVWLDTWRFNKEATIEKGLTEGKDDLIACKIIKVKKYSIHPYNVECKVIVTKDNTGETSMSTMNFRISPQCIRKLIE